MSFKKNFKIGELALPNNIIYAPLAEYTDFPFRRIIRHFHKGLMFCEMIKMEALVREKSCSLLKYSENMRPIGAQLCGTSPIIAKEAAKKIEDCGFDLIDLNCGCPVPKVVKDGSGSALLKNPQLIFEILSAIKKSVKIPVTVKIRIGWDDASICAKEIVKIAEDAGCSAITIHGRTKKQGYSGKARWEHIKDCKEVASDILVIGNGDLYSPTDVENMFEQTNCDGVMLARGMLANPNLSHEIEKYFTKTDILPIQFDRKEVLLKYISYIMEEKSNWKTVLDVRRICGWLLREKTNIKQLRIGVNSAESIEETIELIQSFNWDT